MFLPPEVIEKIKKERDRQNQIRIPLQPEIPASKDHLENPEENKKRKPKAPLIIQLD